MIEWKQHQSRSQKNFSRPISAEAPKPIKQMLRQKLKAVPIKRGLIIASPFPLQRAAVKNQVR